MGDNLSKKIIVTNYSITDYFKRKNLSIIKINSLYYELIVLQPIILIHNFIKAITKIRGSMKVAFLTKKTEFIKK